MACTNSKYVGKTVVLEYAMGCGDEVPTVWKSIGAMRTKEFELAWDTTDATADDSVGALREDLATFQGLTISGDGVCKNGIAAANLIELTKHVANPAGTGGQPVVWMRMTFPDLTFKAFMLLTTMSRSAPYDDVTTYSLESSATASDFGLVVEDTPSPVEVASVTVTPSTAAVVVGSLVALAAAVSPGNASQAVVWTSSATDKATVDSHGHVLGVADGSATITATSVADGSKKATCVVTVTSS